MLKIEITDGKVVESTTYTTCDSLELAVVLNPTPQSTPKMYHRIQAIGGMPHFDGVQINEEDRKELRVPAVSLVARVRFAILLAYETQGCSYEWEEWANYWLNDGERGDIQAFNAWAREYKREKELRKVKKYQLADAARVAASAAKAAAALTGTCSDEETSRFPIALTEWNVMDTAMSMLYFIQTYNPCAVSGFPYRMDALLEASIKVEG